jgi:DNA helicase IV
VAFGTLIVLSEIERRELELSDVARFFPKGITVCRDELGDPTDCETLLKAFRSSIDPEIPIRQLSAQQVGALRAIICPEVVVKDLSLLDIEQAKLATSIGTGHRIITGVPGSGKTVILIARAKLAASNGRSVLVLCYNVALAEYLKRHLTAYPAVEVSTFGRWALGQGAPFNTDDREAFGKSLHELLDAGGGKARSYDVVLIDEAQDFVQSWFRCATLVLKEPSEGDLMIAYDGAQTFYVKSRPVWKHLGINAVGRSRRLGVNYRNTKEIARVAEAFTLQALDDDTDDSPAYVPLDHRECPRSGSAPILIQCDNETEQIEKAAIAAADLVHGRFGTERPALAASNIAILTPPNPQVQAKLRQACRERGMGEVEVQTIRKAKGLQWPAVIVLWAGNEETDQARVSLYVAMTRAEDILIVTSNPTATLAKTLSAAFGAASQPASADPRGSAHEGGRPLAGPPSSIPTG